MSEPKPADLLVVYCPVCDNAALGIHHPDWIVEHWPDWCAHCGQAQLGEFTLAPKAKGSERG